MVKRRREPEVMDEPGLDPGQHMAALRGLARINAISASARILWSPVAELAGRLRTSRLRVLDVAAGAGDIPIAMWRKAQRMGLDLEIQGIDISDRAVTFARERAEACGAPIHFTRLDAVRDSLPVGFDVVVCSLFLHHVDEEVATNLLAKLGSSAAYLMLVNDLRRSRRGLLLAHVAARLLTRSPVVRADAPRSVRAAFTLGEVRRLAAAAGLHDAKVVPRWPCRFLLAWYRQTNIAASANMPGPNANATQGRGA
jgi:2-polyprenyl-3-methyl-5-hydroxy-6-metoxy-1,4-benzoquinol methylase